MTADRFIPIVCISCREIGLISNTTSNPISQFVFVFIEFGWFYFLKNIYLLL